MQTSDSGLAVTHSEFANFVFGCAAVLVGRFAFGLDWVYAALLFFPVFGLFRHLFENDGRGIVKYVSMLALYPFIVFFTPPIVGLYVGKAAQTGNVVNETGASVMATIVSLLLLFCVLAVASFVSGCIEGFSLPRRAHGIAVKILMVCACLLAMAGILSVMQMVDANLFRISMPLKVWLSVMLGIMFCFVLDRSFNGRASGGGGEGTRKVKSKAHSAIKLSDVMGMDRAKEQIRLRLIEPVRNPKRAKLYGIKTGGGVLLYGPPGTGKTMLARAVAGELNLPFYMITSADVFGKYVGESEGNIRRIFSEVRGNPLSVVFIDELETLFPKRTAEVHETTRKVISLLLQELDGLDDAKNPILLLGATNMPWMVDEAFLRPGRFDVKIFVDLPDAEARRKMLIAAFAKGKIPHEPGLTAYIANRTKNYSGADLNGVMDRLRQLAYLRRAECYDRALADEAISAVTPTANGALMDQIHDWEAETMGDASGNAGGNGIRIAERPTVTLADVAGMDDVKEQIRMRLIEPMRNTTLADLYGIRAGGGMLLYGPPGTGKTFLAKAVAGELNLPFFAITAADIFGKYIGESENNARRIFREIRKNDFSVVFIDELETIFPKRTADVHETTRKVISLLLQELDGLDATKNPILLLGATNVPWMVDEAFLRPGRFDIKMYVGAPDFEARRYLVGRALKSGSVPYEEGIVEQIAGRTEGFSGADINGIVERMRQLAFRERRSCYTADIADAALDGAHSSIDGELAARIMEWGRR